MAGRELLSDARLIKDENVVDGTTLMAVISTKANSYTVLTGEQAAAMEEASPATLLATSVSISETINGGPEQKHSVESISFPQSMSIPLKCQRGETEKQTSNIASNKLHVCYQRASLLNVKGRETDQKDSINPMSCSHSKSPL